MHDEISENIARALDRAFARFSSLAVDPAAYDLDLRAVPRSYAPDELRTLTGLLEVVTECAPHFVAAWGRLGYVRAFLHMYLPFADRAASAARVARESSHAWRSMRRTSMPWRHSFSSLRRSDDLVMRWYDYEPPECSSGSPGSPLGLIHRSLVGRGRRP